MTSGRIIFIILTIIGAVVYIIITINTFMRYNRPPSQFDTVTQDDGHIFFFKDAWYWDKPLTDSPITGPLPSNEKWNNNVPAPYDAIVYNKAYNPSDTANINPKFYYFIGNNYYTGSGEKDTSAPGPYIINSPSNKGMSSLLPNGPWDGITIDANNTNKWYFFKDDIYYDATWSSTNGLNNPNVIGPLNISKNFPGVPNKINAVISTASPQSAKLTFFKDDKYWITDNSSNMCGNKPQASWNYIDDGYNNVYNKADSTFITNDKK